ncbi:CmcJ/NvfI family oxidoreductase [Microbacterium sp. 18062]|uniref:CmcJ/NvfI family oxidoreductase n=1 Tax=Microbacterium sp. 18062 TaxID=2681410 RepID=UPI00135B0A9A|nr:CmcJ/NvfI family oxidoreductase [Microbacterium sp. 18062]
MSAIETEITYYTPDRRVEPDVRPDFNALPLQSWPVRIEDLRRGSTSLDREGFQLVESRSAVRDFHDLDEVDAVYVEEMKELVRETTGATTTRLSGKPGLRSSAPVDRRGAASMMTGSFVHADVSPKGAQTYLDWYLPEEAEHWRERRWAIFNVWRPFSAPPQDWPLAVCDTQSVDPGDTQLCDIVLTTRTGDRQWETQAYVHNPAHRWLSAWDMTRDDALLFRTFDTAYDEPVPHSAFVNPTAPPDVPPRESVEIRIFALFED